MFKGPQGMSLAGNAAAASAAAVASAAATFADTAAADKTKMGAYSLIFRAIKWWFSLALGGYATRTPHQEKINCHREIPKEIGLRKLT